MLDIKLLNQLQRQGKIDRQIVSLWFDKINEFRPLSHLHTFMSDITR